MIDQWLAVRQLRDGRWMRCFPGNEPGGLTAKVRETGRRDLAEQPS